MKEIWKDIQGYEGKYQVSNLGNVKSFWKDRNGKIMKSSANKRGYYQVYLYSDSKPRKRYFLHRLVSQAFIENPDNLPFVNHIDEDKSNNYVENLEWCTAEYNNNYGAHNERILKTKKLRNCETAPKEVLQFTKDGKFVNEFPSICEAERCTGINQGNICSCCKNIKSHLTAGGFKWKYKEDVK